MTVTCDQCGRDVPVAPSTYHVTCAHIHHPAHIEHAKPCQGNLKRQWRGALEPISTTIARQYAVLGDDRYWDAL